MKQKLLAFFMVGMMLIGSAFAQRIVSGTVISQEDGSTLPGVSVQVSGTTVGTQTDVNGHYSLSVPATATTINFSFIGFVTQSVTIGNQTAINVSLASDATQLGEVVVTAVGITREAKSLGYSASVLRTDDLTVARESNVLNSLAGKAAGVRVNSTSGTLGGSAKIVIRGVNSLESNSVLFVVDGVPVSNSTSVGGTGGTVDFGNRMGDLGSDDIESMTVLKGAAATALYGSRAKDGAIIITTKKGNRNTPMSIDVNSSVRFESPLILPDFQNEYAQGNQGVYSLKYENGWGPKIADVQDQTFKDFLGDDVKLQAHPDNVKDFFQTGVSYINNISFSGGDEKSDYRLGISAINESGIIPESTLDKYNFTVNAGRQFSPKVSSRFSGMYTNIGSDGRPAQSSNNTNIITSSIYSLPRVVDINKLKANFEDPITGEQIFMSTDKNGNNPYWILNYNKSSNKVDRFVGSYNVTYKPVDWITISNNLGGDIYTEKRSTVVRKGTAGTINGKFTNTDLFYKQLNNDLIVTVDRDVNEDLSLKLIVGNNINEVTSESTNVDAVDLTIDQLWNYTNAASKTPTLTYSKRRIIGVYGDLGFNYKDFLYANVTGRNDWSSTLPVANRSYFYPSVSGGLIFSELLKDSNMDWLSFGKLRGSWASVGSDLTAYQLDYQYTPVSQVFFQFLGNSNIFPIGPITTAFTGPRILPNENLKPQRQKSFEIGTDLRFFSNRLGVDFTYYNTVTRDQLIPIDIATSTGYRSKYVNVGAIRNKGVELMLTGTPVKTRDFAWDINVNFAKNNQVVEELTEGITQYSLASGWSGLQIKAEVGEPFSIYGSAWAVDPASGKYIIDANSGFKTTVLDQNLGSIYPDWTMGINNQFSYKGISLSALVDIRQGGVFYSGTVSDLRTGGMAIETGGDRGPFVDDGVILQGDTYVPNTVPVAGAQEYWSNEAKSDNTQGNLFDASFIKLREVRLGYALPQSLLKNTSAIKGIEIGVEGRNLWLIKSHVPHVDPELNFFGAGSVGEGVEFNSMPSTRSFGFNLRLKF
ncbi:SusC/RagA family TonB-linked outer membrane protein [Albibacterium bauzanense]|uniref:TonB-linked SusC/RagA family outer membrane protein n=1 Tax=Albibacterium bauzanense TaxID=653929 RepID=A0A4R1M104_9SPHI|nr:SusC/RagA family TonB-linked outer membrane protein [Albibacterium bauzanense]TCK83209.1 TonB-linked SusC/RagA family outer membrane protein [Albibacterium bauzanense]